MDAAIALVPLVPVEQPLPVLLGRPWLKRALLRLFSLIDIDPIRILPLLQVLEINVQAQLGLKGLLPCLRHLLAHL